jgi:glycine/D-amino acid oxidase-like deaminating enzyme
VYLNGPGWDDDPVVAAWAGLPPLPGDETADACVVGLGASGLAAVEALVERGLSVIGLDAGRIAGAAAGRNGGFLLGGPAPFVHQAVAGWGETAAIGLYRETLAELDRLIDTLGPDVVRRTGSIRLAHDDAERADCGRHAATLLAHGIAVEDFVGELGRGLFLPNDATVNPAVRALLTAERLSRRARLHEHSTVTDIASGRVTTPFGVVSAGVIVIAVDGGLERLVPSLAGVVRTARLQMLSTAPGSVPVERVSCPIYDRWGYDYAQVDPAGRLYVGGGRDRFRADEWTTDTAPTPSVQGYLDGVAERLAGRPVGAIRRWGASAGFTDDGRAVVAPVDAGVVVCGGYSGTGNLVGSVAARAAVALAVDGTQPASYFRSTLPGGSSG